MKAYLKLTSLLLALLLALPAAAMTLNEAMSALGEAKASGVLGEKPDGYLGVVRSSKNAEDIASQINQARRAEYHRVAKQNGISVSDVEAIAGKKAIEKTPPGQIIQLNGNWVRSDPRRWSGLPDHRAHRPISAYSSVRPCALTTSDFCRNLRSRSTRYCAHQSRSSSSTITS